MEQPAVSIDGKKYKVLTIAWSPFGRISYIVIDKENKKEDSPVTIFFDKDMNLEGFLKEEQS